MVKIIAHRGASAEEPENTLTAIKKALEMGVDFIEIDVHLSKDRVPVVIHDETLCRTTNAEKGQKIRETESLRVKHYDAGHWFHGVATEERVPLLEEVLELDFGDTGLMIEIKDDIQHDLSSAVFSMIKSSKIKELIVGSFSHHSLSFFHQTYPRFDLIGIIDTWESVDPFLFIDTDRLAIDQAILNAPLPQKVRERFSEVWAYTVDNPERAKELVSFGIDGIITNNPRVCLSQIGC